MTTSSLRLAFCGSALAVLIMAADSAIADGGTPRNAESKPFVTLTPSDLLKGPPDPTPKQIETAQKTKESRPATEDLEGHWGDLTEGFLLSVRFEKDSAQAGEPVVATIIIRNAAEKNVYYRDF